MSLPQADQVSELKNREAELRTQSAILELTLENMGQGITLVDGDLNTVAVNRKFLELQGFPEAPKSITPE